MQQLYRHVTGHTASFWAHSFVKQLISEVANASDSNPTPFLDVDNLLRKYHGSKKRLLFFDYDGTLTPIRKMPNAAVPPPDMLKYMQKLAEDPNNIVWVISGRDQAALDEWLGNVDNLGLSAEHGCFTKGPDSKKWINLTEELDMSWKNDVIEIFTYYTERTQGSFIEHKRSSLTWHYRMADPEYGAFQAKECQNHLENAVLSKLPVEILVGKKNLEVRPTSINKGEIVKRLLAANPGADFAFCAGDDKTDEDMFRALRKSDLSEKDFYCVTVGPSDKKTIANWHVNTSDDIVRVIGTLVGAGNFDIKKSVQINEEEA
ncbi:trehalose-phosphatase-domain-containing protein [Jimgerdemannia flammicorona]|uniref:Trehalose 6-phosphate phosphatase n=1 Tax=Jimgerdemannia flammicorona TaxID=994334 RepID=A0A433Q6B6_9FUNG|nr:trehalose-phosphatase-domain-containing protein [Jimgerdemannia flammicorona]